MDLERFYKKNRSLKLLVGQGVLVQPLIEDPEKKYFSNRRSEQIESQNGKEPTEKQSMIKMRERKLEAIEEKNGRNRSQTKK